MELLKRPVAFNLGSTSAILWWETDGVDVGGHGLNVTKDGSDAVFYAATTQSFQTPAGRQVLAHHVEVEDIPEESLFTVQVVSDNYLSTPTWSFSCPGTSDSLNFMILNGSEGNMADLASVVSAKHTDGDSIISCGGLAEIAERPTYDDLIKVHDTLEDLLQTSLGTVIAPSETSESLTGTYVTPTSPDRSPYYAMTVGPVRFLCLDTTKSGRKTLASGGKQVRWFLNQIQSSEWKNAGYRVILGSTPPCTSLWSIENKYENGKDNFLEKSIVPLIKKSGATMAIFGEGHSYQRGVMVSTLESFEDNPTYYIVSSGFNSRHLERRGNWDSLKDPGFLIRSSALHYLKLQVTSTSATLIARETSNDAIIDQISFSYKTLS
jgi:hypothetical protein